MSNKAKEKVEAEAPKAEVLPIVLESNVGLCGLKITASLKQNAELAAKFLGFFLWHDGASAVFGGGKKAKFSRDSAYSEDLGKHAQSVLAKILEPFFDVSSIEVFAHVKQSEEQKFMTFCKKLGMSEEMAKAGWTTAQAAKAEPEAKPEAKTEEKVLE
jgi:hypothetical protein